MVVKHNIDAVYDLVQFESSVISYGSQTNNDAFIY